MLSPAHKVASRLEAENRYGHIDFASRHWPDQGKWIKLLEIPDTWFPHWTVLGTKIPVKHIACNIDMHQPLYLALQAIYGLGLGSELKTFDGCFNIRAVRGSTHASTHSYGLAIDLDARSNPMGKILRTTLSKNLVSAFKAQGFDWGGDFKSRKDPMHFSFAWE